MNQNDKAEDAYDIREELFHSMTRHSNEVYKFVKLYNDYTNIARDYGTGAKVNMLSVHIMSDIEENPGITGTDLANEW